LLNHIAAGFRAGPAFFGAVGHDFVTGRLLACGSAIVAALRATVTRMAHERALARREGSRQLTARGTVHAQLGGPYVMLLAARYEAEAMSMARITAQLTIGACSSARHKGLFGFRIGRRTQRRQHSGYQQSSSR
jgi:hypothetical protein